VKTLLQLAATFAMISVGVGVAVVVWDEHRIAGRAATSLEHEDALVLHADGVLTKTEGEWQNEKADLRSIIGFARDAASQADQFTQDQRKQLQKTSRDSDNQVRALGLVTRNAETFFYNLDQQLNGHVLPDFDRELVATSTAAQFSFESLTKAGDALTFQINDPALPQMLESFNKAAASLSVASANGADILGHADHVAAYYDKKLTTPLGFWKTLGKSALTIGAQAGSISAGFVK
jgi:hypothetical protein